MDSEALKFKSACENENRIFAAITEKEIVSEEMAYESLIIVKNLKLVGVGDALIYAAALNVLNTYVKQSSENKKAVGYSFKKNVDVLIKYITRNPDELIKAEIQMDRNMPLCMAEIGGIQFSFHNVEMNSNNRKLAVKEGEETMIWDGIRKQNCAVSVFNFAMASEYDRGNKMMDGSDFVKGLSDMTEKYRAGTSTISDAKKMIFGDNRTGASSAKVETEETVVYPYRNEPVAPLYQGDIETVIERLNKRTFISYLLKVYEQDFGFKLSKMTEIEWKYASESIGRLLKGMEVDPGCGIKIDCCRLAGIEFLTLTFMSSNQDNSVNIVAVQLLSWEEMQYEKDGSVTYSDYDRGMKLKASHPSSVMSMFMNMEFGDFANDPMYDTRACVFMYDASLTKKTDIVSNCPKEIIGEAPIFYSGEADGIREYLSRVLAEGNGRKVISEINKIRDGRRLAKVGKVSREHVYITEKLIKGLAKYENGLVLINNRKCRGNDDYINYLTEQFGMNGIRYRLCRNDDEADALRNSEDEGCNIIFYDFVPDNIDLDYMRNYLIIVDKYGLGEEDIGRLAFYIEQTADTERRYIYYEPSKALGYIDRGAGNNWLIRNLTLGDIDYQRWIPSIYPIDIVNDPSEFAETQGIADVTIPDSVRYDDTKGSIKAEYDVRAEIYRALTYGKKGVRLYIGDAGLRDHLRNALEESKKHSEWMDSGIRNVGGDIEQYIKKFRDTLNNTNSYIMYEALAKQSIGISAWNKMKEDSQGWLVSALLSFNDMKNTDPLMDFSGVTLMISKVFENELTIRICDQYESYLQKKYGDRFMDELPVDLVEINQYGEKKILGSNRMTLGSIPFIMGMESKGTIKDEHEYENFKAFCVDELLADTTDIDGTLQEICDIVYYVRVNFRNKSAHKDVIDITVATDCIEYCVTVQRKLGCIMDMFAK